MQMQIPLVEDFTFKDDEIHPIWRQFEWFNLQKVEGPLNYSTRAKVLYSLSGLYFFVECEDSLLHCQIHNDNDDIYLEDVVEIFLWPDTNKVIYFEYEISPLETELTLIIPNHNGTFMGWIPWHYEDDRKIKKKTTIIGGLKQSMTKVKGWTTEIYIPFSLLKGLGNMPPIKGTIWRANINRLDYDNDLVTKWAWDPLVAGQFHDYSNFGTFIF